jgi:hypothetical protein
LSETNRIITLIEKQGTAEFSPFAIHYHHKKKRSVTDMCLDVRKTCECGMHSVQFHLRDNIMAPQVISRLFCPSCKGDKPIEPQSMLYDNGWIIEYDIDLARGLLGQKLKTDAEDVTPEYIFDKGYACWLEMYPGEKEDIKEDRQKIMELLQEDRNVYLQAMQKWNIERIERLKSAGWRKVQQA